MPTRQPNSRHCFVCGLENPNGLQLIFHETAPGEVTAEILPPEHFQGFPGLLHGGIAASMLDEAAGRALMGCDRDNPRFMYTARLDIRYRRKIPLGATLRLVGRVLKDRGRTATALAAIYRLKPDYPETEELLAEAEALLISVPDDTFSGMDLEALGWKVYD